MSYRLYSDDWGIASHEIGAKLSQYVTPGIFARYRYRYYTQGPADFYRDDYPTITGVDGYLTGDYRMGDLSAHLFGAALNFELDPMVAESSTFRRLGVWVSYERYFNSDNYSSDTYATGVTWRL